MRAHLCRRGAFVSCVFLCSGLTAMQAAAATETTTSSSTSSSASTATSSTSTTSSTLAPTPAILLPGRKLLVREQKSGIQHLRMLATDSAIAPGSPCELDGELVVEAVGIEAPVVRHKLAAGLWKPIKPRHPERGCKYRNGPIVATVQIKTGKFLKVVAKADDLGIPLVVDPRPLRLEVRHGDRRYCLEFGGAKGRHSTKKLVAKVAGPPTDCPQGPPSGAVAAGPVGALSHTGRWLTDETGRVVLLHGTNLIQKFADPPPRQRFDADEAAAFLRQQGFNGFRLGIHFGAIMPAPGEIDMEYVTAIAATARTLAREGIYVLIDMHQAGYGSLFGGDGFPEWASLTDGLPNTLDPFPLYYFTNPALQRAFENFWDNREGPDGVPLQEHYATAFQTIAAEVADEPRILGYELMNEPWPGADWEACQTGCPDKEQARLVPFGERMAGAIREIEPDRLVFSEPWLLFIFGQTDTSLSGIGAPASALSFHVYASTFGGSPELDEAAIDRAIAASSRGDAILATEFGATNDVATIRRLTDAFDTRLVPWLFWTWGRLIIERKEPLTPDNIEADTVEALARPYASATNGTPESFAYDPDNGSFDYTWSTRRPSGEPAPPNLPTTIVMPPLAYPEGYSVTVEGGRVLSEPCARPLLVGHRYGASTVRVWATRSGDCDGTGTH